MSTYNYDFRVLIETLSGSRYSYGTGSFIQVGSAPVTMATSGAVDVITNMPSMSYYNAEHYTSGSLYVNNIDTTRTFTQTRLQGSTLGNQSNYQFLSASIKGNRGSGSILFEPNMEVAWTGSNGQHRDFLKRYKFFGNKVCNVLGIPENFWIYSDRFRLSNTGSEQNIIRGDVLGNSIHAKKNIAISNAGNFASDLPFHHSKNTDRWVKWTNTSGSIPQNDMLIGYSNLSDDYMIRMQNNKRLVMSGSNSNLEVQGFPNLKLTGAGIQSLQLTSTNQSDGALQIKNNSGIGIIENTYNDNLGNITLQVNGFTNAISIDRSAKSVGIGTTVSDGDSKLKVNGAITATNITASGDISAVSMSLGETHTPPHALSVSGSINATDNIFGYIPMSYQFSGKANLIASNQEEWLAHDTARADGGAAAIDDSNNEISRALMVPFDGYVKKAFIRCEGTPGDLKMRIYKAGVLGNLASLDSSANRMTSDGVSRDVDIANISFPLEFDSAPDGDYSFNAGEILALSVENDTSAAYGDTLVTLILMMRVQ